MSPGGPLAAPRRASRRPRRAGAPAAWQPTHRLRWFPRAGLAREWFVQVVTQGAGRHATGTARTLDEAQAGRHPAWALTAGAWRWHGGGWQGEDGVATVEPIRPR